LIDDALQTHLSFSFSATTVINRYGFNSKGHQVVKENLFRLKHDDSNKSPAIKSLGQEANGLPKKHSHRSLIIGLNLGKNKVSPESCINDYILGLTHFASHPVVDYFVINVSSPNTPGLRKLQGVTHLENLLSSISRLKSSGIIPETKPVLLKISPDLSHEERQDISRVIMTSNQSFHSTSGRNIIDGIIVSNTTVTRPQEGGDAQVMCETGGLSGLPLKSLSTQSIHDMYSLTKGKMPIIGVGGIFTGQDAFEKITAGASLLQIYTSFTFEGPPVVNAIRRDLSKILKENGFASVSEAVGADHNQKE